jgi:hypothetical protein
MPTRTSPSQLDRDIEATVGKRIDRKKLAGLMLPWGSDSSYGQGSGAIGAVASYYSDGKKYPDRKWVERALKQVNEDLPRAEEGAHGWTKADAKTLRTIAAGLRHYLVHDYKAGDISHSRGRTPMTTHRSHAAIKTISPVQMSQLNIAADYGRKARRAGHGLSPGTDAPFQAWRRLAGLSPIPGNHAWMSGWFEAKNPGRSVNFMSAAHEVI